MIKETVPIVDSSPVHPAMGSAGLRTELAGQATTVSAVAMATGGIGRGKIIERDTK